MDSDFISGDGERVRAILAALEARTACLPEDIRAGLLADIHQLDALRASANRFRGMLEDSIDLVYRRDLRADRYEYMSPVSETLLGFTPEAMTAMRIDEIMARIHPDDRDGIAAALDQATMQGKGRLTYRFTRKDGRVIWVADFVTVQKDAQGQPRYRTGVLRDITDYKEMELALRHTQERFETALDPLQISVFSQDNALRYTWVYNSRDMGVGEVLGRRDDEIFPLEDVAELIATKHMAMTTGLPVQREFRFQHEGQWKQFLITLNPLQDAAGTVTGLTGAALDVTEQRRLEENERTALTQMEVHHRLLEHREQERQEIARNIHDGPTQSLVSILFDLQMAREGLTDPSAISIVDKTVTKLKASVRELRSVIDNLRPPTLIHYGLARAIQIHSEEIRTHYPEIQLDLDLVEDEHLLPEDTCLALYRIYQECVVNIIRHANTTQAGVRYYPAGDNMVLEVRDNGSGFCLPSDWADLPRQNHFGLVGIKERADAINARLVVDTAPGHGTRVEVRVGI